MRYQKAEALFHVALAMQGTAEGLSLDDIERETGQGRRSAERLRDVIGKLFPAMELANPGEVPKRWRLARGTIDRFVAISADEFSSLATAAALLRRENMGPQADAVERAAAKLRALSMPRALARMEPDLEALTEAEGLALRPGPRPKINGETIATLREAILGCRKVRLHYLYRISGKRGYQIVHPYGFLYGNRHYLVAWNESERARDFRNYALANIDRVEVVDTSFRRRRFSLREYAGQSFGLFRETPVDVVWRFPEKAAADAREYLFHPSQKFEQQPDGSLIVRFCAGGLREMAWHLVTWLPEVEVIAPKRLQELLFELAGLMSSDRPKGAGKDRRARRLVHPSIEIRKSGQH